MSITDEFDDMVKVCEFYSGDDLPAWEGGL